MEWKVAGKEEEGGCLCAMRRLVNDKLSYLLITFHVS